MACDDAAISTERKSRLQYSKYLVEIAETIVRDPVSYGSASALIRQKNELLNRVRYQMKEGNMFSLSKKKTTVVLATLALLILPLSWYYSDATPDPGSKKAHSKAKSSDSGKMQFINVSVAGEKGIVIDNENASLDVFKKKMKETVKGDLEKVVVNLVCEDHVPMASLNAVQKQLIELGLFKVNYIGGPEKGMPLMLPPTDYEKKLATIGEEHIATLEIEADGKVFLDGMKTDVAKLGKIVRDRLDENDKLIISLHTADKSTYRDFVAVMSQLKKADAPRILIHVPTS
jgi:biopolymer transport protein ExbD